MSNDVSSKTFIRVVGNEFRGGVSTRIEGLKYSSDELKVSVASDCGRATVLFEQVYGFRMLDESDLDDMSPQFPLRIGWLFEVVSGGWKDLEMTRPRFLSGRNNWTVEYLVAGSNECVAVLTKEVPKVLLNPIDSIRKSSENGADLL